MTDSVHATEVSEGVRFAFGDNWAQFLLNVDENRIAIAEQSLLGLLGVSDLKGLSFLDIGSGSGLFSLAARRLGATVRSFDYDPASVACTAELKRRYYPDDEKWQVGEGSITDASFVKSLGQWDVVYSWGVLHHTGAMYDALHNAGTLVKKDGLLAIAIYNDQGRASKGWLRVKQLYNRLPRSLRWLVLWPSFVRLWGPTTIREAVRGRPFQTWREYAAKSMRGMSPWRDVVDWVGGLPFEVARPEEIFAFYRERNFEMLDLRTCAGGIGCNEFVMRNRGAAWR